MVEGLERTSGGRMKMAKPANDLQVIRMDD
jgi:hypothetical protein